VVTSLIEDDVKEIIRSNKFCNTAKLWEKQERAKAYVEDAVI